MELNTQGVPFRREVELPVSYKGLKLACAYRADFVCFNEAIVELKAASAIGPVDEAQILNYLRASGFPVALLLNFAKPKLEYRRFVWSNDAARTGS